MSQNLKIKEKNEEIEEFIKDESKLPRTFEKKSIVEGKVVKVKDGEIFVNVGGRAEGIVSGKELMLDGEKEEFKVGDNVLVYVINPENDKGWMELSIRRTQEARKWDLLNKALERGDVLEVTVIEANNGGVIVNIKKDLRGFIPTSQLDNKRIYPLNAFSSKTDASKELQKKLASLINEKIKAKIIEIDMDKNRVILSEKLASIEGKIESREEILKRIKIGDVLDGEVTGLAPFGLFVNASGLEGLVHLSEISWDKVENPADFYKVGDKVKVQIIGIDDNGRRIAFSIKKLKVDPWSEIIKKYKVGQIVSGEVQKVVDYGAFVRIDKGVNGLIHISELSNGLVSDPNKYVKVGETYKLQIISISKSERHLGLSLKRVNAKKIESKSLKKEEAKVKTQKDEGGAELKSLKE